MNESVSILNFLRDFMWLKCPDPPSRHEVLYESRVAFYISMSVNAAPVSAACSLHISLRLSPHLSAMRRKRENLMQDIGVHRGLNNSPTFL
jgi:hypothetical protein